MGVKWGAGDVVHMDVVDWGRWSGTGVADGRALKKGCACVTAWWLAVVVAVGRQSRQGRAKRRHGRFVHLQQAVLAIPPFLFQFLHRFTAIFHTCPAVLVAQFSYSESYVIRTSDVLYLYYRSFLPHCTARSALYCTIKRHRL